ncbi:hypothetical protein [Vallicoccus soli]|uniref:Lipoprotein n=1 Tax=Vallicoccus soli TaxID=2339232 RepID=A0A3A3YNC3_9ACTN|nr:hypothetical protein [Vallicoccus soli]RJK92638.1 hypothetical protein D5H78_18565 [Vallicoccus soli]
MDGRRTRAAAGAGAPALAAALLLGGCGTPVEQDAARAAGEGFAAALRAGDGERACALLAPRTLEELESSAGRPCPAAVLSEGLPVPGALVASDVWGRQARLEMARDVLFVAVAPGGWRVTAAGCSWRGEDVPYDCSVQGG